MLSRGDLDKIKKEIEEFFRRMTVEIEAETLEQKEDTICFGIRVKEPQVLIGERGQTLLDMQHLLSAMIRKKVEAMFYLDLDINEYKKKKTEYLKELARSVAEDVVLNKKEKTLPAMPAYERRIIHMELAERRNVVTESFGKDPDRRIIIKPYP